VTHFQGYRAMAVPRMNALPKILRELGFFMNSFKKGLAAPRFGIWLQKGCLKMIRGRSLEQEQSAVATLSGLPVHNIEHHDAHAASAVMPSGFTTGYAMTLDGEGDGYSCCLYKVRNRSLKKIKSFYHNELTIGRDYEKVTAMLGFHPLRHPGKITGLSAFGTHNSACIDRLTEYLKDSWKIDRHRVLSTAQAYQIISPDGRKQLMDDRVTCFKSFSREDMAFAIQYITEQKVLDIIRKYIPGIEGSDIALAGGVFANVALNKKIKDMGFGRIFIQPAMTDAGLSMGSLLHFLPNHVIKPADNVFFGPSYSEDQIRKMLESEGISYESPDDPATATAKLLAEGKVVARFDGHMEFGPRALGNRSILYKADDPSVNDWLNRKLQRTEFMPFAPVTLDRFAGDYYKNVEGAERTAKFMTITFDCTDRMKSESPAVVHIDGTARPQLLDPADNPGYAAILEAYYGMTGVPTLVNTSFNMHEEPIVMTPQDAIRAFYASELDAILMGPYLIRSH
jgi:carbamoyltransferase